jgi:hypothetical protein
MQSKQCNGVACYEDELDEWETSATFVTSPTTETTTTGPTTTTTTMMTTSADDAMNYDVTTEEGLYLSKKLS